MIHESYPWKQDLLRRKRLILKYNCANLLSEDSAYTVIERAVFYSAFIIRKLIDCRVKVSDEVDAYKFTLKGFRPLRNVDVMHRWPDENSHDWEHEAMTCTKSGKEICNWLIHSHIFFLGFDEDEKIDSFFVSSDYDRNKMLYRIELKDWIAYMEFVGSDSIVDLEMHFDRCKKEYVVAKKERGNSKGSAPVDVVD